MRASVSFAVFLGLVIFTYAASARIVQPDDGPYYRWRRPRVLYVYTGTDQEIVPQIDAYLQAIRERYDQSFNWRLDEEEDLVLVSPNLQQANAYATVMPDIKSVWFPSGSAILDDLAESSWALTLATHETSHLYQLNAKAPVSAALKKVFGNSFYLLPFVWPIFIHPNLLTPTFLIEGNAVLNESRANLGGRLYSGEVRALVLAQLKAGEIDPTRLINNEYRFPYGDNPYYQGAYFEAFLASKHGVDKTNQFYLAQADHYLWPLILNRTFRDHFGASYPQEIHEYVHEMQPLAKNQRTTPTPELLHAPYIGPLNHNETRIFFLASDGIQPPELYILDKATRALTHRTLDLPLGKLFWDQGTPLAASTQQHDLHHFEYSLYGEDHAFDSRYRNQIVNDQRAGKTVSLDAANSWLEPRVLLNGEFYDIGHSSPILDEQGNVYYFRQDGADRILYKNRQPVFKYDGFYGKAMEVGPDGSFYFIANSDFGATLYQYRDHEIQRVLSSDRVVDARRIDDDHFLVTEVYPAGHQIFIADADRKPASPAVYAYGFPSYNLQPKQVADSDQFKQDERPYNASAETRYSALDLVGGYSDGGGFSAYSVASFVDPLEYQSVNLGFSGSQFLAQGFFAQYTYTRFLPSLIARYVYEKNIWQQAGGSNLSSYTQQALAGMQLPLLRWQHWDSSLNVSGTYSNSNSQTFPSLPGVYLPLPEAQETYGTWAQWDLKFSETPDPYIAFYPWRSFTLSYKNQLGTLPDSWAAEYNTSMISTSFEQGFSHQFYATASGGMAWAENHDIAVEYNPYPLTLNIRVPLLASGGSFAAMTADYARVEITKVFDTPLYSPRIPVGLDRIAPFIVGQNIFLDPDGAGYGTYPTSIFEWGYGVDIQILLAHLTSTKIRLMKAFDIANSDRSDVQASLALHMQF